MKGLTAIALIGGVAAFGWPSFTFAQDASPAPAPAPAAGDGSQAIALLKDSPDLAGKYEIDTSIPEAPGFAVIGLSPSKVIDPGATRVTFASLASYLDPNGNLKPGFALGGSPYWWFSRSTLSQYQDTTYFTRLFARTQISVGYANGANSTSDNLGVGFSTELLDDSDYRRNNQLYNCVGGASNLVYTAIDADEQVERQKEIAKADQDWKLAPGSRPQLSPHDQGELGYFKGMGADGVATAQEEADWKSEYRAELHSAWLTSRKSSIPANSEKQFEDATKKCQSDFSSKHQSLVIAGGAAFQTQGKNTGPQGGSMWASYKHPLDLTASLATPNYFGVFLRYDFDRKPDVATFAGQTTGSQTNDRGLAAIFVGYEAKIWKISLQGGFEQDSFHGSGPLKSDSYGFYSLEYSYNVSKSVWLDLQAGNRNDQVSRSLHKDSYVVLNLHLAPNLLSGASQ